MFTDDTKLNQTDNFIEWAYTIEGEIANKLKCAFSNRDSRFVNNYNFFEIAMKEMIEDYNNNDLSSNNAQLIEELEDLYKKHH